MNEDIEELSNHLKKYYENDKWGYFDKLSAYLLQYYIPRKRLLTLEEIDEAISHTKEWDYLYSQTDASSLDRAIVKIAQAIHTAQQSKLTSSKERE